MAATAWISLEREATVARLVAANTAAGARVYDWRTQDISADTDTFPMIIVRTESARRSIRSQGSKICEAVIPIAVECYVRGGTDTAIAQALDALEQSVYVALLWNQTWIQRYKDVQHVATTYQADGSQAKRIGYSVSLFVVTLEIARTVTTGEALETVVAEVAPINPATDGPTVTPIGGTTVDDLDE